MHVISDPQNDVLNNEIWANSIVSVLFKRHSPILNLTPFCVIRILKEKK